MQESFYGYVVWIFAQHFLNRLGQDYAMLASILDPNNSAHAEVLSNIKKRLRQETFTPEFILGIVLQYPELLRLCYGNFALAHYFQSSSYPKHKHSLSREGIVVVQSTPQSHEDASPTRTESQDALHQRIKETVQNQNELKVFESFLTFNRHVLKTNFYQPTKVALSFRLDPSFLPVLEYPSRVFGMFLVIGSEFRGFHLRFRDIARGGIRIIRSPSREQFHINLRNLFDENYNLAATQQRKNRDIPEGGSKGTILLDFEQVDKARSAFEKYVDGILDLLLVGETPGIKERLVDRYLRPEILFFGPDEGTAEFMDWASLHARRRKAPFWKAFTTGKSQSLG